MKRIWDVVYSAEAIALLMALTIASALVWAGYWVLKHI